MVIKVAFGGHVQMRATDKRCNLHWSISEQLGCVSEFIDQQMALGNKWEKEICRSRILALRFPVHTLRRFR